MINIGIIGAGASGIMAAIQAADCGACVTLFEKKDRIGKKILVTGNGRCNFTNMSMGKEYYYCDNPDFISEIYNRFDNNDLIHFFMNQGLLIKEKNGYVYPACEQASSVLDVLRIALKERNINILSEVNITSIEKTASGYKCISADNTEYIFDKVIISAGGKSSLQKNEKANGYDICRKLGLKMTPLYPALTQINCEGLNFASIQGVRQDCELKIFVNDIEMMQQKGEILFTENGISGIVTFQISHLAAKAIAEKNKVRVLIDLLNDLSKEDIINFVKTKLLLYPDINLEEFFTGFLNKKINIELIKAMGLKPSCVVNSISCDKLCEIALLMKQIQLNVIGTNGFDKSQVTGGGVDISQITENLEVKNLPGLYITGELLDVDGLCGGYNLQWAFSTGYIAGLSAASK